MKAERLERATRNIENRLEECETLPNANGYAARVRGEIAAARRRIEAALSTPARKRAERAYRDLLLYYEEETYQDHCVRYWRDFDAEQQAAALSRGVDYMTEQRNRDRVYMIYGG